MSEPITPEMIRSEASNLRYTGRPHHASFMLLVASYVEHLQSALQEMISIIDIQSVATGRNFAWAEMAYAKEVLKGQSLSKSANTHCDSCGCTWLDDGLNPVECPYCRITRAETRLDRYDTACEAMAIRLLGQERYDNSPCQAHSMELIEEEFQKVSLERDTFKRLASEFNEELVRRDLNALTESRSKVNTPDQKHM